MNLLGNMQLLKELLCVTALLNYSRQGQKWHTLVTVQPKWQQKLNVEWGQFIFFRWSSLFFLLPNDQQDYRTATVCLCSDFEQLYLSPALRTLCERGLWPEVTRRTSSDASLYNDTPQMFCTDTRIRRLEKESVKHIVRKHIFSSAMSVATA